VASRRPAPTPVAAPGSAAGVVPGSAAGVVPGPAAGVAARLVASAERLRERLAPLRFAPPVTHVYQPLDYAWEPHRRYLESLGEGTGRTVLLGMNPGPFGMAQTGVPFGDVAMVRDWLGIVGAVARPAIEHPQRPVRGFDCPRSEVSGSRFWGWARDRFGTAERFFARFVVLNYCPLAFMEESGRNRTPDQLPANERGPLFAACDEALRQAASALRPAAVVGIGRFAAARAAQALAGSAVEVGCILHPSPANPGANRDWEGTVERQLAALGVWPLAGGAGA
jgi:single-strand selective monofunctional uracil DNA glycosylase